MAFLYILSVIPCGHLHSFFNPYISFPVDTPLAVNMKVICNRLLSICSYVVKRFESFFGYLESIRSHHCLVNSVFSSFSDVFIS